MSKKVVNNFNAYEQDFQKDTGLTKKDNIDTYINYVNARVADKNMQLNNFIHTELVNLPDLLAHKINMGRGNS